MNALNSRLWLMWAVATFFFAYQFVMRVTPGLVMPELMQKFQIDAASFGLFASAYYFGYAGMQIPIAAILGSGIFAWINKSKQVTYQMSIFS